MDWLDGTLMLTAFYLYNKTPPVYEKISLAVFLWFFISDIVAHHFLLDLRSSNHWVIYQLYNLINVAVMYFLFKNKSHVSILAILVANVLLNIIASLYFVGSTIPIEVYNIYPYLAGVCMILAILYMWALSNGNNIANGNDNNRRISGPIHRFRVWLLDGAVS